MVTAIVCVAIGVVVMIATDLYKEDSVARVQERNKDLAESLAGQTMIILKDVSEKWPWWPRRSPKKGAKP